MMNRTFLYFLDNRQKIGLVRGDNKDIAEWRLQMHFGPNIEPELYEVYENGYGIENIQEIIC